jgi:hypothetical protein
MHAMTTYECDASGIKFFSLDMNSPVPVTSTIKVTFHAPYQHVIGGCTLVNGNQTQSIYIPFKCIEINRNQRGERAWNTFVSLHLDSKHERMRLYTAFCYWPPWRSLEIILGAIFMCGCHAVRSETEKRRKKTRDTKGVYVIEYEDVEE